MQKDTLSLITIPVIRLPHLDDLPMPDYVTEGASGLDLVAAIVEDLAMDPMDTALIPTGLKVAIPGGFEIQIRPRSGLAIKNGITVVNAPGTIDSDYRGEIKIGMINLGKKRFVIKRGMRIAQAVLSRVYRLKWAECSGLPGSRRGSGGFGHTGI